LANRGEIWLADFDPVRGHEQGRQRPALVLSTDQFNNGPAGLLVVVPFTTRERARMPMRVRVDPPEGGLTETSWALCEALRSISTSRLVQDEPCGTVSARTLATVEHRIRTLLEL
jgi:mRNA interferase MazF